MLDQAPETLLQYTAEGLACNDAACIFDVCSSLIPKLDGFIGREGLEPIQWMDGGEVPQQSWDEKFLANLLHLLRRLQTSLFLILIYNTKDEFGGLLRALRTHCEIQQLTSNSCVKEWPGGRQLLTTTWPWNIRSSLVVLWVINHQPTPQLDSDSDREFVGCFTLQSRIDLQLRGPLQNRSRGRFCLHRSGRNHFQTQLDSKVSTLLRFTRCYRSLKIPRNLQLFHPLP